MATSNINLYGVGGVEEGSAPPLPPPARRPRSRDLRLGGTIRCGGGSQAGAVRVVAAAGRNKATLPPIPPTQRPSGPCSLQRPPCGRSASTTVSLGT